MTADHLLIEAARSLAPQIAPRGPEIEALRRLPPDIAAAMGAAGFYRMYIAERIGGLEVSPMVAARVSEELGAADASAAWVAFIGSTTGLALARVSDEGTAEMFARPETLLTGVFASLGVATKVEGGFRVTGQWPWGSGSDNAAWIGGGCSIVEDGQALTNSAGAPRNHMIFFPAEEVTSLDTWHVSGLSGSGSTSFAVRDVFVPERRVSGYQVKAPPERPLFRYPPFAILAQGVSAVALGVARGALDEFARLASQKGRGGASAPMAGRPHVQIEVAKAEARLRSARAWHYEAIEAAWDAAQSGDPLDIGLTRDLRTAVYHATHEATAAVDVVYTLAGGASVFRTSPLQRQFRDIHVATQHFMVSTNILETAGRLYLGLETNTAGF